MARRKLIGVVRYLHQLTTSQSGIGPSDGELLERYVRHRDEAAFELLLWRHGALVLNVCRRILQREQDAEDAFQATFLAFIRKAHAIVRRDSVSSWLYKVAYRVALEAKARARKIAAREKPGGESSALQPSPDPVWNELRTTLDEEVNRLPERLRRPFVLCYLEGKTNEEAARQIGCRPGTVYSRLSRAREMLRHRLLRRGVTLSSAALAAALGQHAAEAAPTAPLVTTTLRAALVFAGKQAAGAGVSAQVIALAEGVLRTMFVTKLKMAALMLFVVGLLAAGGVLTQHALTAAPEPPAQKEAPPTVPDVARKIEDKKPAVWVVQPMPGGRERMSYLVGHARASAQQQLVPSVSGYLKRQLVDIGDHVKKGDLLAEIDAPLLLVEARQAEAAVALAKGQVREAAARVDTAEAELKATVNLVRQREAEVKTSMAMLKFREKQFKRYQELLKTRAIDAQLVDEQEAQLEEAKAKVRATEVTLTGAQSDVAVKESKVVSAKAGLMSAEAGVRMAQFALEKAQIQIEFTRIVSSYDGVVTQRNSNVGDYISASDQSGARPLMIVQRTDLLRVVVDVPEKDVSLTHPGVTVDLRSYVLPGVEFPHCMVSRTGFSLNERTATMPAEIDVPNPKGLLRPGMNINVTLHLDKAPTNAFTIPRSCLVLDEGRWTVYVFRDGKAHRTPVRTGVENGDKVEVLSGLQATDRIVLDPKGLSGDVVPVEVKKEP